MPQVTVPAATGFNYGKVGDVAWTNPGNVAADDGSRATASVASGQTTQQLQVGFDFSAIPAGSTINDIDFTIQARDTNAGESLATFIEVRQIIEGSSAGNSLHAEAGALTGTDADYDFTGALGTIPTRTQLVGEDYFLGVRLDSGGETSAAIEIDYVEATVDYDPPASPIDSLHQNNGEAMMRAVAKGSTNQDVTIRIVDASDGTPEEAVEHNSTGIALWYRRQGGAKVAITPVALSALDDAHTDGGIEHIDDGYYRLDVPDAAFATGADHVQIGGTVDGMIVLGVTIQLTEVNLQDASNAGISVLTEVVRAGETYTFINQQTQQSANVSIGVTA